MRRLLLFSTLIIIVKLISAQTCDVLNNPYANQNQWTRVDPTSRFDLIWHHSASPNFPGVGNDFIEFDDWHAGDEERLFIPLNKSLSPSDSWKAEFDFYLGAGNPSGHALFSLTAGSQDPINNCLFDVTTSTYPYPGECWWPQNRPDDTDQDAIIVRFGTSTPDPNGGGMSLLVMIKDGVLASNNYYLNTESKTTQSIPIVIEDDSLTYHVKLFKCGDVLTLELWLLNTLVGERKLTMPANFILSPLTHVQHATIPQGLPARSLTGAIGNTCIKTITNSTPTLSGFNGVSFAHEIYACQGQTCLQIFASDPDPGTTLQYALNYFPPGATFTPNSMGALICWDPTKTQAPGVYNFDISVSDGLDCGTVSNNYVITVHEGYDIPNQITVCEYDGAFVLNNPGQGDYFIDLGNGFLTPLPGGVIDPTAYSPGSYTLYYCVPEGSSPNTECTGCFPIPFEVIGAPSVFPYEVRIEFCENEMDYLLPDLYPGGTWSGPVMIGSNNDYYFSPSILGVNTAPGHQLTYTIVIGNCTIQRPYYLKVFPVRPDLYINPYVQLAYQQTVSLGPASCTYELIDITSGYGGFSSYSCALPISFPSATMSWSTFFSIINSCQNTLGVFDLGKYYVFKRICSNENGCPYNEFFTVQFVDDSYDCTNINLTLAATNVTSYPKTGFQVYNFTPTVNPSTPSQWTISIGSVLGMFSSGYTLQSGFNSNPPSNILIDFYNQTPNIVGTGLPIPVCDIYDICLTASYPYAAGVSITCEVCMPVPICDQELALRKGKSKSKEITVEYKELKIDLFPNPTSDNIYLQIENPEKINVQYEIFSSTGKLIAKQDILGQSSIQVTMNMADYSKGIYYLKLSIGDKVVTEKIIRY